MAMMPTTRAKTSNGSSSPPEMIPVSPDPNEEPSLVTAMETPSPPPPSSTPPRETTLSTPEKYATPEELRTNIDLHREYIRRYQEGDRRAGEVLLRLHEPWVIKVVGKYARFLRQDYADLKQEGRMGVLKALSRFDFRSVHPLSYIHHWVRAYVRGYIINKGFAVRVPMNKYDEKRSDHTYALGRRYSFTFSEMPDHMRDDWRVSFEDTLTDDNPLADETISEGELEVYLSVFLSDLLTKLDPRERNVVDRRFTNNPETLEEIANSYGLSRERVRQIEERCLNKLRDAMAKGGHLGVPGTWRIGLDDWPVVMDKMTLAGE